MLLAGWVLVVFARQVSDAAAAAAIADADARHKRRRWRPRSRPSSSELELIERQEYIAQQARSYRFGAGKEIPFTLDPDAPPLPSDAPGSAAP